MFNLSEVTKRRIKKFIEIKRAFISLIILSSIFTISLFSELLANNKPILIKYNKKLYFFPVYRFYSDKTFGGQYDTQADYVTLEQSERFKKKIITVETFESILKKIKKQNDKEFIKKLYKLEEIPKEFTMIKFENKILKKIKDTNDKTLIKNFYQIEENERKYRLKPNIDDTIKIKIKEILKNIHYFKLFFLKKNITKNDKNKLYDIFDAIGYDKSNFMIFPIIKNGPYNSSFDIDKNPPTPPDKNHIFGTDDRGRDVFVRLLYGFRISMFFALILLSIEIFFAILIGGLQGYLGGIFDISIQRFIEILASLPFLYIVILVGNTLGQNLVTLIMIMSVFNWIGLSYYMRSEFLRIKQFQFIEAAVATGKRRFKILFDEILPNAITPLVTFAPFSLIGAISVLSSLDYLGFGLPAPTPSWGELIKQGMEPVNMSAYWLSIYPILALFLTLLLTTFIGEGLRESFDPKEYSKIE